MTREEKISELHHFCSMQDRCDQCELYDLTLDCEFNGMDDKKIDIFYAVTVGYKTREGEDDAKEKPKTVTENLTGVVKGKKRILDACCGSRMFYFDKKNPEVLYQDNRELETTLSDGRHLLIKPDVRMDFRNMKYEDNSFKVVVFDPPHLAHAGTGSWLAKKYGILPKDWPTYLKQGFDECMRVLEPDGLLVFKWNEDQIPLKKVLEQFGYKPLLGDQRGKTRWLVFIK